MCTSWYKSSLWFYLYISIAQSFPGWLRFHTATFVGFADFKAWTWFKHKNVHVVYLHFLWGYFLILCLGDSVAKYCAFFSGKQINWRFQQIFDLQDKSPYFAITDFNDITALSFDHQVSSFHEYLWSVNWSPILMQEQSQEGEKCGFFYAWAEYYLQPNSLFVGSSSQVMWWALGQWKGRKICIEW